ncbi:MULTISPECIES: hypothetical protein [Paraburkholderia]|uniref:Uncharacterized protein n=2 Tax=Paraburkholderia fungorum TaxID=134537 RepID=A0AAP5QFH4_9BURK|nr:hypothetical protein [Paraburkholderia fungorum]MBU7436323.1 hypothetical protein [Paraburkholderia fungorum]MDT8841279.1 hypothetical protein [Paraburkholderia fungorum]
MWTSSTIPHESRKLKRLSAIYRQIFVFKLQFYVDKTGFIMDTLQETLKDVQLRLSVAHRKRLTHKDMAELARVSPRALGEWMRGATAPAGMTALLRLLSQLPLDQVGEVLLQWQHDESEDTTGGDASEDARPGGH